MIALAGDLRKAARPRFGLILCAVAFGVAAQPAAAASVDEIEIRAEKLASGVRLIVARTPAVTSQEPRAYVASYVDFGTMDEQVPGEAHLIEHVLANSPASVPAPPAPSDAKSFEGNALTKPNHTSFVVVVSPNSLERWIHSRLSILGRRQDDAEVYRKEVGRVVAELNRARSGSYLAYKALHAMARGQPPRLTDEIAWTERVVEARVRDTIRHKYRPSSGVLVVAGDIDPERTIAIARAAEQRLRLEPEPKAVPARRDPQLRGGLSRVIRSQNLGTATVAGLAWPQPSAGSRDFLAFLIADQLMLGGRTDPTKVQRSDASPLATRLNASLGATGVEDARDPMWGAPPMADLDPSLYVVQFSSQRNLEPKQVRAAASSALRQIRRTGLSDARIEEAREALAKFYEAWLLEPTYRILADHLAAFAFDGRNPEEVKRIPAMIRGIAPDAVRRAFDRHLLRSEPLVVVLPPAAVK